MCPDGRCRSNLRFFVKLRLLDLIHRLADECCGPAELCGTRGVVAEHLAVLAGTGEPGEQSVQVADEDCRGAAFGGLLLHVGEVGLE